MIYWNYCLRTLFPGGLPSESVAINVVTVEPTATSSSKVIGCGINVNTGGMSLRSCKRYTQQVKLLNNSEKVKSLIRSTFFLYAIILIRHVFGGLRFTVHYPVKVRLQSKFLLTHCSSEILRSIVQKIFSKLILKS